MWVVVYRRRWNHPLRPGGAPMGQPVRWRRPLGGARVGSVGDDIGGDASCSRMWRKPLMRKTFHPIIGATVVVLVAVFCVWRAAL